MGANMTTRKRLSFLSTMIVFLVVYGFISFYLGLSDIQMILISKKSLSDLMAQSGLQVAFSQLMNSHLLVSVFLIIVFAAYSKSSRQVEENIASNVLDKAKSHGVVLNDATSRSDEQISQLVDLILDENRELKTEKEQMADELRTKSESLERAKQRFLIMQSLNTTDSAMSETLNRIGQMLSVDNPEIRLEVGKNSWQTSSFSASSKEMTVSFHGHGLSGRFKIIDLADKSNKVVLEDETLEDLKKIGITIADRLA
jgi:hypothetical protein